MLYAVTLLLIVFILPTFNSGRKSVEGELFYETSVKKRIPLFAVCQHFEDCVSGV